MEDKASHVALVTWLILGTSSNMLGDEPKLT